MDTDTPYLQLDNMIFKGEFKHTVGTDLVFQRPSIQRMVRHGPDWLKA